MKRLLFPVSMTVLWGIVFAMCMHDTVVGICRGILMGTVFGLFDKDNDYEQEENASGGVKDDR